MEGSCDLGPCQSSSGAAMSTKSTRPTVRATRSSPRSIGSGNSWGRMFFARSVWWNRFNVTSRPPFRIGRLPGSARGFGFSKRLQNAIAREPSPTETSSIVGAGIDLTSLQRPAWGPPRKGGIRRELGRVSRARSSVVDDSGWVNRPRIEFHNLNSDIAEASAIERVGI